MTGVGAHAVALTALGGLLIAPAPLAIAITVTFSLPAADSWSALSDVAVAGTAGAPSADSRTVGPLTGLGNGTFNKASLENESGITLARTNLTYVRYFSNFTYPSETRLHTREPMWARGGIVSDYYSANLSDPPAVLGSINGLLEWHGVSPRPIVEASVSFRYLTVGANLFWEAWVFPENNWSARSQILRSAVDPPETEFSYNLTSLVSNWTSFSVGMWINYQCDDPQQSCGGGGAMDDFEVVIGYEAANGTSDWSHADGFDHGPESNWEAIDGRRWQTVNGSSPNGSSLAHVIDPWVTVPWSSNVTYRLHAGTEIVGARVAFNYGCEANGRLEAFVGPGAISADTRIVNSSYGQPWASYEGNVTSMIGNQTLQLRIWAYATASIGNCSIADFRIDLTLRNEANSFRRGEYTSAALDFGLAVNWTTLEHVVSLSPRSGSALFIRNGTDGSNWSEWLPASNGSAIPFAPCRFAQFRAVMWGYDDDGLPALQSVTFRFYAFADVRASTDNWTTWAQLAFEATPVPGQINWSGNVTLSPGSNNVVVRAYDTTGAFNSTNRTLYYDAFPPSTPGAPIPDAAFVNRTILNWSWAPSVDVGLGVAEYQVGVGTLPGADDLLSSFSVGPATSFSYPGGQHGGVYYLKVRARDGAGLWGNWSDPSIATVVDRQGPVPSKPMTASPWVNRTTVSWTWLPFADNESGVEAYDVRVGTTPLGADVVNGATSSGETFTLVNATEGATYYLLVRGRDRAQNAGSWSESSDGVSIDLDSPPAPAGLTGPSGFSNVLSPAWSWQEVVDSPSGVDHYLVIAGSTPGLADVLAETPVASTTYVLDSIPEWSTLFFGVRAVDVAGNAGGWSYSVDPLLIDRTQPSSVFLSESPPAWVNSTILNWMWSASTDSFAGISGYLVRVGTAPQDESIVREVLTPTESFMVPSASEGVPIVLSVRPVDRAGNLGSWTVSTLTKVDRTAPSTPGTPEAPQSPSNLSVVTWTWNQSADAGSGMAGYDVQVGTSPSAGDVQPWSATSGLSFDFEVPWSGVRYFLAIRAVDSVGWRSSAIVDLLGVLVDLEPPSQVIAFSVNLTRDTTAPISWAPAFDEGGAGLQGYELEATAGGSTTTSVYEPAILSSTIAGLDGRQTLWRIRAVDKAGNRGPWSTPSSVLFDWSPPSPVTGIRGSVNGTRVAWEWDESSDPASGVAGYLVSVGTEPGIDDVASRKMVSGSRFAIDAVRGTTYYLSVLPIDVAGNEGPPTTTQKGQALPEEAKPGVQNYESILWGALVAIGVTAPILLWRRKRN